MGLLGRGGGPGGVDTDYRGTGAGGSQAAGGQKGPSESRIRIDRQARDPARNRARSESNSQARPKRLLLAT
jgi:hypothetical protein